MALASGTRLGVYEITAAIGAGGMGEVYRARDTRLDRDVAIKILPEPFAADPDRLARFDREAKALAALNHPNIAIIHGVEEGPAFDSAQGGSAGQYGRALVMELVEGPTLADRIAGGPLPIDEALPIARQIAEALEAAHEHGIIHRDLKPANIKVRGESTVKVLDFGLAKLGEGGPPKGGPHEVAAGFSRPDATASPTITSPALMTGVGMLLGTAAYMSPEQARGTAVDKRSDIWAFGCVLYEMLTGTRAFDGDEVADTLALVLTRQPDWSALPPTTPQAVRRLLRRCLEKDRRRRLADAADARLELEDPAADGGVPAAAPIPRRIVRDVIVAAAAFLIGATAIAVWWRSSSPTPAAPAPVRFAIPLAPGEQFGESGSVILAVSADGRRIAYAVGNRLHLRSMGDLEARPVTGTENQAGQVRAPLFTPDGESIVFVSSVPARIKRVPVGGGAAVTICDGCGPLGAMSWHDGGIVFAQGGQGMPQGFAGERAVGKNRIMRVPANGGEPEVLFEVNDGTPWDATMLPDGEHVLFSVIDDIGAAVGTGQIASDEGRVVVQSLRTGERKTLVDNARSARYVNSGHLVYVRQGLLFARRFDLARLEAVGGETPVVEGVRRASFVGGGGLSAYYDISDSGSLAYVPGPGSIDVRMDLGVLDPRAGTRALNLPPGPYAYPRVSPDGKLIAVGANDVRSAHIWIYDRTGSNAFRQLTFVGRNRFPIWSADGRWITFQSDREGDLALFRQRADGSGVAERLTKPEAAATHIPNAWGPGDQVLLFEMLSDTTERTLWTRSADGTVRRFSDVTIPQGLGGPIDAVFSPNGRWVAYKAIAGSGSARQPIVIVEPSTPDGTKHLIGNGMHPAWSRDGKTLYFRRVTVGDFFAARILGEAPFAFATPERLPKTFEHRQSNSSPRYYDVTPEGTFIGVILGGSGTAERAGQINVVLNWLDELKRRVP